MQDHVGYFRISKPLITGDISDPIHKSVTTKLLAAFKTRRSQRSVTAPIRAELGLPCMLLQSRKRCFNKGSDQVENHDTFQALATHEAQMSHLQRSLHVRNCSLDVFSGACLSPRCSANVPMRSRDCENMTACVAPNSSPWIVSPLTHKVCVTSDSVATYEL